MLKRKFADYLEKWRSEKNNECLLIKGARQVGKTHTVRAFGENGYKSYIELNFVEHPEYRQIFDGDLSASSILSRISLVIPGVAFPSKSTLLFLDEIQECPNARTALKFLAQRNDIDVIASGSLLGITYRQAEIVSIPVGYEHQVTMHGLDFEEFCWARGYGEDALEVLRGHLDSEEAVPQIVHDSMMRTLREFMVIGGMPAVVQHYVDTGNFSEAFDAQQMILASYLDDIAKYAPSNLREKSRACYLSIPAQLAKENTKFQYGIVERKGTARKFDTSLGWLEEANLVYRCNCVSLPAFPLSAYRRTDRFRMYLSDMGLLVSMYGFEMMAAIVNDTLTGPMKGGLYENLVADMLVKSGRSLSYWMNDRGDEEIEFLLDGNGASVVPVEVKAKRGSTASLNRMLEREDVRVGYKFGSVNVGRSGKKVSLPLYMGMFLFR